MNENERTAEEQRIEEQYRARGVEHYHRAPELPDGYPAPMILPARDTGAWMNSDPPPFGEGVRAWAEW